MNKAFLLLKKLASLVAVWVLKGVAWPFRKLVQILDAVIDKALTLGV